MNSDNNNERAPAEDDSMTVSGIHLEVSADRESIDDGAAPRRRSQATTLMTSSSLREAQRFV